MNRLWTFSALCLVTLCSFSATVLADPRALIIGVGEYRRADWNLPGVDLDVANMRDMARLMGFRPEQIHVLTDKGATHARVVQEMSTWLRTGVKNNDNVLIYFSGHGTRVADLNGDEEDGADEALLMYDSRFTRGGGEGVQMMADALIDDEIAALIDKIPSRRILMMVDACHSGTVTRDVDFSQFSLGQKAGVQKFISYENMPKGVDASVSDHSSNDDRFVALSAAADTQSAISTDQGSVFTLGVVKSLREAAETAQHLSLNQLRDEVATFIDQRMQPSLRFTPVVSGNPQLASGGLDIVTHPEVDGPSWQELYELAMKGEKLSLQLNKTRYVLGQEVQLRLRLPRDGYLNVVSVDARDHATVLYPNRFHQENFVKAGPFAFPGTDMPFILPAVEPAGRALVVAFLTREPVNFLQLGIEGRDATGQLTETFTEPTKLGMRTIGAATEGSPFASAAVEVAIDAASSK